MKIVHTTAQACHYDKDAHLYDQFNEENSQIINKQIATILNNYKIKTVLDLTCGTGSQVFYLTHHGYDVIGSDINAKMLQIAQDKAKQLGHNIKFIQGDMRNVNIGTFDAIITIFNAIGHLTKSDFETAIKNIYTNLNTNGLYVFDIFNLDYLLCQNNITKLTIDWQIIKDDSKAREIQYSTIDHKGTLASYTIMHEQKDDQEPVISQSFQTLQVYTAQELTKMLEQNRFKVLKQTSTDGSIFDQHTTERILTVAQKVS